MIGVTYFAYFSAKILLSVFNSFQVVVWQTFHLEQFISGFYLFVINIIIIFD